MGAPLSSGTLLTSYLKSTSTTKPGLRGGVKMAPKMWISLCFLIIHFLTKNGCFAGPSLCNPVCPEVFKPVCDSMGTTHDNECLFEYAACKFAEKGKYITKVHDGFCGAIKCYNAQNNGVDYRGTKSVTLSGKTCQKWSTQTPHDHDYKPKDYPELQENYCRNPDGEEDGGPWCYTTDPNERWEYCLRPCKALKVPVIREVEIVGGVAGASSSWYTGDWSNPENAFEQDLRDGWSSGKFASKKYYYPFPHMIWYVFPPHKAFIPAEVTFRPTQGGGAVDHAPRSFQFVGSNEPGCNATSPWAILCEDRSFGDYNSAGDIKSCVVSEKIKTKFCCLGLRILANSNGQETALQAMRFWEKIIYHDD